MQLFRAGMLSNYEISKIFRRKFTEDEAAVLKKQIKKIGIQQTLFLVLCIAGLIFLYKVVPMEETEIFFQKAENISPLLGELLLMTGIASGIFAIFGVTYFGIRTYIAWGQLRFLWGFYPNIEKRS